MDKLEIKEKLTKIEFKAQGAPGKNGKSAYEIAIEAGFVGTEEEWLDSLKADLNVENLGNGITIFKNKDNYTIKLKSLISKDNLIKIVDSIDNNEIEVSFDKKNLTLTIKQIESLQDTIDIINNSLNTLTDSVDTINTSITNINTQLDDLNTSLNLLDTIVEGNTEDITDLQTSVTNIINTLNTLNNDIDTLKTLNKLTTKGDLLTINNTTYARLAVGTDGQVLTADSTTATGLRWGEAPESVYNEQNWRILRIHASTGGEISRSNAFMTNAFVLNKEGLEATIVRNDIVGKENYYGFARNLLRHSNPGSVSPISRLELGPHWFNVYTYSNHEFIFGQEYNTDRGKIFLGLGNNSVGALNINNYATLTNIIGIGYDNDDTNFQIFINNSNTATPPQKIDCSTLVGNLIATDYQARIIEKRLKFTLEIGLSNTDNIRVRLTDLSSGRTGVREITMTKKPDITEFFKTNITASCRTTTSTRMDGVALFNYFGRTRV